MKAQHVVKVGNCFYRSVMGYLLEVTVTNNNEDTLADLSNTTGVKMVSCT